MKEKYYIKNSEKIKQKAKDKRLERNKLLPDLNLKCSYCNIFFILPGMNARGFKQSSVKYCSTVCQDREVRLKKLKIPKWLYNFYLNKKLFHLVAGYKLRKHWNPFNFTCRRFPIDKIFKKFKKIFISNYGQKPLIYQKTKEFFFHRTITSEGVFTYKLKTWRRFLFGRERKKCLFCQESIIHLARDANYCNRSCYEKHNYKKPVRPLLSKLMGKGAYIIYRRYGIKKIFIHQRSLNKYIKLRTYTKRKLNYFKFYIIVPFINFYHYLFFRCRWCNIPLEGNSQSVYCSKSCLTKYQKYCKRLFPIWFYKNIYTKYNLYKIRWQYYPKIKNICKIFYVKIIKFSKKKIKDFKNKKPRVEKKIRLANCKQCEKEFNWEVIVPITSEYNPKSYVKNFCGNECRILFKQEIEIKRKARNLAAWGTEHRPDAETRRIIKNKKHAKWDKQKKIDDPAYKLIRRMRLRTKKVLGVNYRRTTRMTDVYTRLCIKDGQELKKHLESLWKPGMSWENYGSQTGWVIDHIIPLKYYKNNFDLVNDIEIQKKAFGIQNLQPLWWLENAKKSAKLNYNEFR